MSHHIIAATLAERVSTALDAYAHLPNGTPCQFCHGGTMPALPSPVARALGLRATRRACGECHGTGARHCAYLCGRLAVAYGLTSERFVCWTCATLGDTPEPCCVCGTGQGEAVELGGGGGVSATCGHWHRACGRFCCSEACGEQHEATCVPVAGVLLAAVQPDKMRT